MLDEENIIVEPVVTSTSNKSTISVGFHACPNVHQTGLVLPTKLLRWNFEATHYHSMIIKLSRHTRQN